MSNQDIVDYLQECGVCLICVLRYFKARGTDYENKRQFFRQLKAEYKVGPNEASPTKTETSPTKTETSPTKTETSPTKTETSPTKTETSPTKTETTPATTESPVKADAAYEASPHKQRRLNPCTTCLGLFSKEFQQQLVDKITTSGIDAYDAEGIVLALSMPQMLQIRQLSMWYALIRKFRNFVPHRVPDVPLKEAVKLILNPIVCKKLNKTYDLNGLTVYITLGHSEDEAEMAQLTRLQSEAFPKQPVEVSRGVFDKQYDPVHVDDTLFEQYLPIPPAVPASMLTLDAVKLTGPTICVAGRYKKLTRELSHTPWVLNGKRMMEDSIEEILIRTIGPHFCHDTGKIIFMSSGREDVDVRCLGKGRPFVLEIPGSYRSKLSKEKAIEMELEIEASQKIAVQDLQVVPRDDLVHIKTGEEKKRKFYRALCALQQPVSVEILEKLNLPEGFEIQQKTPIRVLHRRPLLARPRMIYSMKAWARPDKPHVIVLDVVSQAGTYIKELVHGEFGRTQPSVASLIGQPIDILALDVTGIDLEWPPVVGNRE